MQGEPRELVEAKQHLLQFEHSLYDQAGNYHLEEALALLVDVIVGKAAETHKSIAKTLVSTHINNVLSKAKQILGDESTENENRLDHLFNLMDLFESSGLEIGEDFSLTKKQLTAKTVDILLIRQGATTSVREAVRKLLLEE